MTADEMLEYAKRYRALWREHDLEGLIALHHPDCELHVLGSEPVHGVDAIREIFKTLFEQAPDLYFEGRHLHAGTDHFVSEWTVSATPPSEVSLFGLSGTTDRKLSCNGTDVFTVKDGLIMSKHTYWDTLAISQQMAAETAAA